MTVHSSYTLGHKRKMWNLSRLRFWSLFAIQEQGLPRFDLLYFSRFIQQRIMKTVTQ